MFRVIHRSRRIPKVERIDIRQLTAAVKAGETRNHLEVAIDLGIHPVDGARILAAYARMYGPNTVARYSQENG